MINKPVKPELHGIIDYAFSAIQLVAPSLLGINKQAKRIYQFMGGGFLVMNSLSDTPVGIKQVITFRGHQKADAAFLAGLSMLTLAKQVRKDKTALRFHLGFLSLAVLHYILTDYDA